MVADLDEARLRGANVKDGHFDTEAKLEAYLAAFRAYGIDVATLPVEEAAQRVRSSPIADDLIAALDDWATDKSTNVPRLAAGGDRPGGRDRPEPGRHPRRGRPRATSAGLRRLCERRTTGGSWARGSGPSSTPCCGSTRRGASRCSKRSAASTRPTSGSTTTSAMAYQDARPPQARGGRPLPLGGRRPPTRQPGRPLQPRHRPESPGGARRGHRRVPRGDPAQARLRRGPLQPRRSPCRPGEARRGHRRLPRGDPAQARLRRGPLQPRHRPGGQGRARRGHRRLPRGDPAQARLRRGPLQPRRSPCESRGSSTRPSPPSARRSGSSPTIAEAHYNLGIALRAQGEARRGHRRLPRGDPAQARRCRGPLNNLGDTLAAQGKLDEAIAAYPRGDPAPARLRRGPPQPRHRPEGPGETDEAVAAYREAIRLKPDYAEATTTSASP